MDLYWSTCLSTARLSAESGGSASSAYNMANRTTWHGRGGMSAAAGAHRAAALMTESPSRSDF